MKSARAHSHSSFLFLVVGLISLSFGLKMTHGMPQLGYVWTLPLSLLCFAAALFPFGDFSMTPWLKRACLTLPVWFFIAGAVFFKPNHYVPPTVVYSEPIREWMVTLGQAGDYLAALTALICLFAASRSKEKIAEIFFQVTLLIAGAISLLVLAAEPRPWIDVWTVQEGATQALLNLKNPYAVEHYNIYPQFLKGDLNPFGVIFVYMPGIIYLMLPFKAIGLDTRVPLALATTLSAFAIGWLAKGAGLTGARRYVPALIFASVPFAPFMLSMAWNDVLSVLFIPFVALSIQRRNHILFYASMAGLLLIKQHIAVCFPLLFWVGHREIGLKFWRSLLIIGASTVALCLPFLFWGWRDFLGSLWGLHFLKYPTPEHVSERQDSFTLFYWLREQVGGALPPGILAITGGGTLLFSFWLWKKSPTLERLMILSGLILMNTFAFSATAFLNYYWVPMAFFVTALASAKGPNVTPAEIVIR